MTWEIIFIADNNRVRKVSPDGIITTVVGNGSWGYSGDGGLATSAPLENVTAVALDSKHALLIADGPRIRRVSKMALSVPWQARTALVATPEMEALQPARN